MKHCQIEVLERVAALAYGIGSIFPVNHQKIFPSELCYYVIFSVLEVFEGAGQILTEYVRFFMCEREQFFCGGGQRGSHLITVWICWSQYPHS